MTLRSASRPGFVVFAICAVMLLPGVSRVMAATQAKPCIVVPAYAGFIFTSADGVRWSRRAIPQSRMSMAAGASATRMIIAFEDHSLITSTDHGKTWHRASGRVLRKTVLNAVAPGPGKSWVGVGSDGAAAWSPDGRRWHASESNTTRDFSAVAEGNGTWVAVGSPGFPFSIAGVIATSTDGGQHWTARATDQQLNSVAWNGAQWLAVGERWDDATHDEYGVVWTSTDAQNWTQQDFRGWFPTDVAWNGHEWLAVSSDLDPNGTDARLIRTSTDGINWQARQKTPNIAFHVAWTGRQWLAIGFTDAWRSTNGDKWKRTLHQLGNLADIAAAC